MKLTYNQLLTSGVHLTEMLTLKPSPTARMSVQIARNVRLVNAALEDFEVARQLLIQPFTNKEGKLDDVTPEQDKIIEVEFGELLKTTVDVDIHPLTMEAIEAVEASRPGYIIPTHVFFNVPWMFDE